MRHTQLHLPIDVHESRRARLERIAAILQGQPIGSVQTAEVYFNEQTAKRAEAIAKNDWERHRIGSRRGEGEAEVSLQATNDRQLTSDANRLSISPSQCSDVLTGTTATVRGHRHTV